jgi:hypothetical protein
MSYIRFAADTSPEYGDLFTWKEFCEAVEQGAVSDEDGIAYLASETKCSILPIRCRDALGWKHLSVKPCSHIMWFNK